MRASSEGRSAPSLRDVAAAAEVSRTTASLILNGKTDDFSPTTVARVLEAAQRLRYRPNAVARSLRRQRTHTVGVISDQIATTAPAGATIRGAHEAAWKAGHVLVVIDTGGDVEFERVAIGALLERQVDGLLYARMKHLVVDVPAELSEVPTVLLNARSPTGEHSGVVPDEAGGARSAVRALTSLGHRRIGFLQSGDAVPAASERLDGYQGALAEAGLSFDPGLVVIDATEGVSPDAAVRLLSGPSPPTAIFAFNDHTALGAYNGATRLGLSVPRDLSIIGFDNQEALAIRLDPPLTSVELPHYEMGWWAMERLEGLIQGQALEPVQHRAACPIVERRSLAPPRSSR
jgi:LacI family transcriptional regulator